jgi:putative oxidoreductase
MLKNTLAKFLLSGSTNMGVDLGLLVLRLWSGLFMLIGHGWGKLHMADTSGFPDPLGIGNQLSWIGAVASEVVFTGMIALGLFTRAAAIPAAFTMLIAAFVIHANDSFFMAGGPAKEPALMYLFSYVAILLAGPGKFSLDHVIFGRGHDTRR